MAGVWSQHSVINEVAATGRSFTISSPRRQYALFWDGLFHGGASGDAALVRVNASAGTDYRNEWALKVEGGAWSNSAVSTSGFFTFQNADSVQHHGMLRLSRRGNYYLASVDNAWVDEDTGAVGRQLWNGRLSLATAPTVIIAHFNLSNAAARWTGQLALWHTDD